MVENSNRREPMSCSPNVRLCADEQRKTNDYYKRGQKREWKK